MEESFIINHLGENRKEYKNAVATPIFPGVTITPLPEKWNLIRISIDLDEPELLVNDLQQALNII